MKRVWRIKRLIECCDVGKKWSTITFSIITKKCGVSILQYITKSTYPLISSEVAYGVVIPFTYPPKNSRHLKGYN